jgi:hypothetical protein
LYTPKISSSLLFKRSIDPSVSAACGHPSLEILALHAHVRGTVEEHYGSQFGRLLWETPQLKEFSLEGFRLVHREGAELMVEGICQRKNLQHFIPDSCNISFAVLTSIAESFVLNQTVNTFEIRNRRGDSDTPDQRAFCETLSRVFGVSTSLESLCLPSMDINAENGLMNVLVDGLSRSNTIKMIDFSSCTMDDTASTCLQQALVGGTENSGTLSVSSIRLPVTTEDGIKTFLRNLGRMPFIKKVILSNSLDADGKSLLLKVSKRRRHFILSRESFPTRAALTL